jgi:Fe-S-cluster containining protein
VENSAAYETKIMLTQTLFEKYSSNEHAQDRRAMIIAEMKNLALSGKNCFSCVGFCCTYAHNSMQVTPLEGIELFYYLAKEGRMTSELIIRLQSTIDQYRLDKDISYGKKSLVRRTYTCPFYNEGPKGCSIAPTYKPLGCLAFNANKVGVSSEGHCSSNQDILMQQEEEWGKIEQEKNEGIKQQMGLTWDKLPMPVALVELSKLLAI